MFTKNAFFLIIISLFLIITSSSSQSSGLEEELKRLLGSRFEVAATTVRESDRSIHFRHLFHDKDDPHIAAIGGGYTSIISCILLASLQKPDGQPALSVHLFEKDLNLMNGASLVPARLHLGGEYPKDETTAMQCLMAALIFRQMFPTESILTLRKYIYFLLAKESTTKPDGDIEGLTLPQLRDHYAKIQTVYRRTFDHLSSEWGTETASRLFGTPDEFFTFLGSPEEIDGETLRHHFAGGIRTNERGFQPIALGVILERLLKERNVHLHLGYAITGAEYIPDHGYKLQCFLTKGGATREFFAKYVINASWHESPYLDHQASLARSMPLSPDFPPTKVYLRSIGLFDVSRCTDIPADRSYFGLMGSAGGMVSFFSPSVAIIYVPEEGLSYQGQYDLRYQREQETILDRDAQSNLEDLDRNIARQRIILSDMLRNVQAKYPFLKDAEPITLLTRTTISWDKEIFKRQHIKANWPLGEGTHWLQAYATKATFSPLIALQVLGQMVAQRDICERIKLSEEAQLFLQNIVRAELTDEIATLPPEFMKLPREFTLFDKDLRRDPKFFAEMQLYAVKRKLPLAMVEAFAAGVTLSPQAQLRMLDWRNLEHVDLRSITPTLEFLTSLAESISSLPPHHHFHSLKFKYHAAEERDISPDHARTGLRLLETLAERPIDELEIDQLYLTLDQEVDALVRIILTSNLQYLNLSRFASHIDPKKLLYSFVLSFDTARSLKSFQFSFKRPPNRETVKIFLQSLHNLPELCDLSMPHSYIGLALGEVDNSSSLDPLIGCIRKSPKLRYLDISDNHLFVDNRQKQKFAMLDVIDENDNLSVNIRSNGLNAEEEDTRRYLWSRRVVKLQAELAALYMSRAHFQYNCKSDLYDVFVGMFCSNGTS